jgi:hypothetical protein
MQRVPDSTRPTANLASPTSGGTVNEGVLNGRDYIDVTFTDTGGSGLDPAPINGDELTRSGTGAGWTTPPTAAMSAANFGEREGAQASRSTAQDENRNALTALFAQRTSDPTDTARVGQVRKLNRSKWLDLSTDTSQNNDGESEQHERRTILDWHGFDDDTDMTSIEPGQKFNPRRD